MESPFKFLDSYIKDDKAIFFGRTREIEQLYQKVFESKLLLVYGVSGTGKSSLIQCGLANKFNDSDWLPINIRRGSNLNDSLNKQITQNLLTKVKETASLKKKINSLYLDHFKPIYFIFDQFEELFIFGSTTERETFEQTLKKQLESDIPCKFIFAIREEYLANVTEFEREIPSFLENRLRIEKMRTTHAKEAIEGPCSYAGIPMDEGFPEALLERLTNEKNEVELTWLQVFLDKLYRSASGEPKQFTHDLLQQMGKVSDLLGSFLEEQISQSTYPDETLAILKSFVSIKGTKRQITMDEVQSYCQTIGKQLADVDLKIELQHLVTLRILRDKDENGRYELRHDALAAKIYEKITLVEKEVMEVRQFVESAHETFLKRNILLNKEDLDYLDKYTSNLFLPKELNDFVLNSKNYELSKSKVVRYITTITAMVFIISIIFLSIFIIRTDNQNSADQDATSSISRIQPIQNKYLLAKNAYLQYKSVLTQKAVYNAFFEAIEKSELKDSILILIPKKIFCDTSIKDIDFSPDGNYLYWILTNNSIGYMNISEGNCKQMPCELDSVIAIEWAPNNNYLATIGNDSIAKIWDSQGNYLFNIKIAFNPINTDDILCFSSSCEQIIALSPEYDFKIYDLTGKCIQKEKKHSENVNSIAISGNDQFLATASSDCTVNIWYYNSIKHQYNFYNAIKEHSDTVWSVDFSKNNQFIVTGSADSSALVISVNGEVFDYADDYFYINWGGHYSKICDAKFSDSEKEIIITHYGEVNQKENSFELSFNKTNMSQNLKSNTIYKNASVQGRKKSQDYLFYSSVTNNRFKEISFMLNGEFSLVIPYLENKALLLYSVNNFKIHEFEADNAKFSPDGKYLLIVLNNKIELLPVNIQDIIQIMGQVFSEENY